MKGRNHRVDQINRFENEKKYDRRRTPGFFGLMYFVACRGGWLHSSGPSHAAPPPKLPAESVRSLQSGGIADVSLVRNAEFEGIVYVASQ